MEIKRQARLLVTFSVQPLSRIWLAACSGAGAALLCVVGLLVLAELMIGLETQVLQAFLVTRGE